MRRNRTMRVSKCDCTRIFRPVNGYLDIIERLFDESQNASRSYGVCEVVLYLAVVSHTLKLEAWECSIADSKTSEQIPPPASREGERSSGPSQIR